MDIKNILFLDIETVPETQHFSDLDETKQALWQHKSQYQRKEEFSPEAFYDRAGIWAEFGKIICISVGYFKSQGDIRTFRVTSFYGEETKILKDFKNLLTYILHMPKIVAINVIVYFYDKIFSSKKVDALCSWLQ